MATATVNRETTPTPVKDVVLTLTPEEARVLHALSLRCGGTGNVRACLREIATAISVAAVNAGAVDMLSTLEDRDRVFQEGTTTRGDL